MEDIEDALAPRFSRSWSRVGGRDKAVFAELSARYSEPHRAYHSLEHIAECLAWFDRLAHLAQRPSELELALFFHDLIYEPTRHDNEARSAERFEQLAHAAGIASAVRGRVSGLILVTTDHQAQAGDAALLCDIDLAILGAPPGRFLQYEAAVRREYAFVQEPCYRIGRGSVLRSLLERWAIYRTDSMTRFLEAQARVNLQNALSLLGTGARFGGAP